MNQHRPIGVLFIALGLLCCAAKGEGVAVIVEGEVISVPGSPSTTRAPAATEGSNRPATTRAVGDEVPFRVRRVAEAAMAVVRKKTMAEVGIAAPTSAEIAQKRRELVAAVPASEVARVAQESNAILAAVDAMVREGATAEEAYKRHLSGTTLSLQSWKTSVSNYKNEQSLQLLKRLASSDPSALYTDDLVRHLLQNERLENAIDRQLATDDAEFARRWRATVKPLALPPEDYAYIMSARQRWWRARFARAHVVVVDAAFALVPELLRQGG
jgi:hypothetical protein